MILRSLLYGLVLITLLPGVESIAQQTEVLNIGIFQDAKPVKAVITAADGAYDVYGDGQRIAGLDGQSLIQLSVEDGHVKVEALSGLLGTYHQLKIVKKEWGATFAVKSIAPRKIEKEFKGNLIVTTDGLSLDLVNSVYIEHYIAGVVESESGINEKEEYYKLQSVICRTYALANLDRHQPQGFQLCDQVHCQAYKGRNKGNPEIYKTAYSTRGYVVVDSDINLITASFHSNCGGRTANSEEVWRYPLTYLRSVRDTFCLQQPHALWERQIPTDKWLEYLKLKYNYPIEDSLWYHTATHYSPPDSYREAREAYFTPLDSNIVLKDVRKDWQLSSTHFSIRKHNGVLNFKGRGYGHGVGLCQEGAMEMANRGYNFTKILHHYYTDVHLIDLSVIEFFRSD